MELDPDFVPPYVGYASAQIGLIQWGSDAIAELQQEADRALQSGFLLDPGYSRLYVGLANLYWSRNDLVAQESALRKALELDPDDPFLQASWAGYLGYTAGKREAAIESWRKYLKSEPLDTSAMENLALNLAQAGRTGEAEAQLRRLIEIAPRQSMGYYFLSDVYQYFLNRIPESLPLRRRAFDLDPEGVSKPQDLARTYLDLGDDASAERWVQIAERINSDSYFAIGARYYLARYRDDKKQAELSGQQMANLVQLVRGDWSTIPDLAWLRELHREDPARAISIYEELDSRLFDETPTVTPNSHAVAISLANLYFQNENDPLANDLLDRTILVLESSTDHYQHIAKTAIYALKGDTSNALKELRISIDANWRWEWWMLEKDPIFQVLWDEPEFKAMMNEIRTDMAKQLEEVREMKRSGELEAIPEAALTE